MKPPRRGTPRALRLGLATLALVALSTGALAQISAEQQSAIRGNCRSDFMSKCSGVPRGGKEALQCLQKNVASLSPACKEAVSATMVAAPPPPAAKTAPPSPPAEPKPAQAAPPPAPAVTAPAPATAPPPPAAAPAPAPKQTLAPPPRAVAPKAETKRMEAPPAAAPQTAYSMAKIEKLRPVERLRIARACDADRDAVCHGVRAGGSRIIVCLTEHAAALSAVCRKAMEPLLR